MNMGYLLHEERGLTYSEQKSLCKNHDYVYRNIARICNCKIYDKKYKDNMSDRKIKSGELITK